MTQTLITRLSKLDAPDRGMDAEIWLVELQSSVSDPFGGYGLAEDWRYEYEAEEDGSVIQYACQGQVTHKIGRRSSPTFTASVDAAIALAERVLPGWKWRVGRTEVFPNGWAYVHKYDPSNCDRIDEAACADGKAANPAIALLIALLRAKEASQ